MSAAPYSRSHWYAEGLRWIGSLLVNAADRLGQPAVESDPTDPWPDLLPPHERVLELRNRVHYY